MGKYIIGVDVGGTNIKLGLVGPSGRILAKTNVSTQSYGHGRAKLIDGLIQAIRQLAQENKIAWKDMRGVGVGLPGPVDFDKGVVVSLTNIPGWRDVSLRDILQQRLQIPVWIDNDVNLITLGEWKFGAGKGCRNLVCMTLGTGVGGGLVLNDALYRGEGFAAGEIGHIPLNEQGPACNCGGAACFERYVGNRYLLARAVKIFKKKDIHLEDIFDLAGQGNSSAIRFWEETAAHVGNALVGIVNLLNPRLIIVGGGVSGNYRFMQETIRKVVRQRAMKVQRNMVKIVRARLGDEAGIIGAYVLGGGSHC